MARRKTEDAAGIEPEDVEVSESDVETGELPVVKATGPQKVVIRNPAMAGVMVSGVQFNGDGAAEVPRDVADHFLRVPGYELA